MSIFILLAFALGILTGREIERYYVKKNNNKERK